MNSKVEFVAADMPLANRFTIHILAAVAEYEAKLISERMRAAFAAAKARGRKFGNPNPATRRFSHEATKARIRAKRVQAKQRALNFLPLLCELRDRGETVHGIALQLTLMNIPTQKKRRVWNDKIVRRMFDYAGELKPKPWASRRWATDRPKLHADLPRLPSR